MKSFKCILLSILTITILTLNSCKKDDVIPKEEDELETNEVIIKENEAFANVIPTAEITTYLTGKIIDEQGNALTDVSVSYKSTTVTTDNEGVFVFGEIQLNEKYAIIKASKTGYLNGFRTFTPTANAFNTISIQLLSKGNAKSFNAATGGSVTIDSDINLDFSANSIIDRNGNAYTGDVMVYGRYLSPTAENLSQIMPGMLVGLSEVGSLDALVSFGMLNIELEDAAGNTIEIAANQTAQIVLPASSNAPVEIPLWHFNESYGLWIEAGKATKTGDRYIGTVSHFSTWNLDTKEEGFDVDVTLQDQSGNKLANQRVDIYNSTNNLLATVYTDNNGEFTLLRAPQNLVFRVIYACDFEDIAKDISSGSATLVANLSGISVRSYTFFGQISDCDNVTYNNKYFTISNANENIYFGGITDNLGNYELTSILCDVDEITEYNLQATVVVGTGTNKDSIFTSTFTNNSQTFNISYCGTDTTITDDNFVIPFLDSNLIQGIRDNINKPTGTIIYGDVKDLDSLILESYNISDITGLEYFTNLIVLSLVNNRLNDIFVLSSLFNLKYLDLHTNNLSDVSYLKNLSNLNHLQLNDNNISDISPISNLTNLQYLSFYENYFITNLSPLSNLINLTTLRFGFNDINDISSLANLINLDDLSITGDDSDFSDISSLANLTNLTKLYLYGNSISDVSPLAGLTNLTILALNYNNISDVSSLCGLGNNFNGLIRLYDNPLTTTDINNLEICLPNADIVF